MHMLLQSFHYPVTLSWILNSTTYAVRTHSTVAVMLRLVPFCTYYFSDPINIIAVSGPANFEKRKIRPLSNLDRGLVPVGNKNVLQRYKVVEESTFGRLLHAIFYPHQCIMSPLWGEKPKIAPPRVNEIPAPCAGLNVADNDSFFLTHSVDAHHLFL